MALRSHSPSVTEAAETTAEQEAMMMAPSYAVLPLDVDLSIKKCPYKLLIGHKNVQNMKFRKLSAGQDAFMSCILCSLICPE